MMLKFWLTVFLFGSPSIVAAELNKNMPIHLPLIDETQSVLFACYRANGTDVEVTACLDHHWKVLDHQLVKTEEALINYFHEVNMNERAKTVLNAEIEFKRWRESQCKMVEYSYLVESGLEQGYLNCLIELTNEQINRLNTVMGVRKTYR